MPTPRNEIRNGFHTIWNEYSPEEMPEYWSKDDFYIMDAKRMDKWCVVVECNEQQAKEMAAYFVNNLFAIPTSTYYDGSRLSLCCIGAGSGAWALYQKTKKYVSKYLGIPL